MELAPFDPVDFKKFTDGKTIVKVSTLYQQIEKADRVRVYQDTDMEPLVENEAKLHITNGIEKASGAAGVDIMVSQSIFLQK